jgi:hypothetical protein
MQVELSNLEPRSRGSGASFFEAAADWRRAAKYFEMTAETACRRAITAPLGACLVLERALDLVQRVPDAARAEIELSILQRLAAMYVSSFAPRAVDTYHTLASRAASYGLIDAEVSASSAWRIRHPG